MPPTRAYLCIYCGRPTEGSRTICVDCSGWDLEELAAVSAANNHTVRSAVLNFQQNHSGDTVTFASGVTMPVEELEHRGLRIQTVEELEHRGLRIQTGSKMGGKRLTPYSPPKRSRYEVLLGDDELGETTPKTPKTNPHLKGTVLWALFEMRQGLKVMRESWGPGSKLWVDPKTKPEQLCYWSPADPLADAQGVVFTVDDVEAQDWIVVDA